MTNTATDEEVSHMMLMATDMSEQGPGMWGTMHMLGREADINHALLPILKTLVAVYADRLKGQDCREHFQGYVKKYSIEPGRAFEWTVLRHNEVSTRIGKLSITLEEAYDIWDPSNIRIGACSESKSARGKSSQIPSTSAASSSAANSTSMNSTASSLKNLSQDQAMSSIQSYNKLILQMGENVSMNPMSLANMFVPRR